MAQIMGSIKQLKRIPSLVLNLQSNNFDVGNLSQSKKSISCLFPAKRLPLLQSFSPPKEIHP
jgi:hypothetical protein